MEKKLKNETAISLNLEARIQKQLEDKNTAEALIEQYDALKTERFKQEDIFLDLRTQQEEASSDFESSLTKDSRKTRSPSLIYIYEKVRVSCETGYSGEDHRSIEDATLSSVR